MGNPGNMKEKIYQVIFGWLAVVFITIVACFWMFWGTIENFHEGWWMPSIWQKIALMFIQYLSFALVTVMIGLVCVSWPRVGGTILFIIGAWFFWEFLPRFSVEDLKSTLISLLVGGLPAFVGLLFLFGRPRPRKWAYLTVVGFPLLTMVICAAEPVWRLSNRIDDCNRGIRLVEGNGVKLYWAPAGPGWAREVGQCCNWEEAKRKCRYLSSDGKTLVDTPQDIWRLPTVEEAVRSMSRHGKNCGGKWDADKEKAFYEIKPDKESPLWDTESGIIYWWTDTEVDDKHAYIIVYHGGVYSRGKKSQMGSQGFRAVKDIDSNK
jgi:hypothetical protein